MINKDRVILDDILFYLDILYTMYDDEVVPTMVDAGDQGDHMEELAELRYKLENMRNCMYNHDHLSEADKCEAHD